MMTTKNITKKQKVYKDAEKAILALVEHLGDLISELEYYGYMRVFETIEDLQKEIDFFENVIVRIEDNSTGED